MNLKELLGTTDGLLNISSLAFSELLDRLTWVPKKTIGEFHLINFAMTEYGDADVWYLIAAKNNLPEGRAPANTTIWIPEFNSIKQATKPVKKSTLNEEVLI